MKKYCFFVSCFVALWSCDPFQMVYVRNYSSSDIFAEISLNNQYHFQKPVSVNFTDSLIKDKNDLIDFNLSEKLFIKDINDSMYEVKLPSGSTTLLSPFCMGFPIQKIMIKSGKNLDSVIFSGLNHNIRYSKKKKTLEKTSFSTFIINIVKE